MDQILNLTAKLISVPSIKDNKKALQEVLDIAISQLEGFTIERFEKNGIPSVLVYKEGKRPKRFKIILNAHLDVVPAKENQFASFEKDGKLYGRGAYDMKTAATVMIEVFKKVAPTLPYALGLQLVTDEETGGHNGTKYQLEQGVYTDFIIAGENTNFAIRNEAKGVVWAKIHSKGKVAHGAYPWLGENALWDLYKSLEKIQNYYPIPQKGEWQTTVNLSTIETANQTFNQVPEDATALLDIRYIAKDQKTIVNKIKKLLSKKSMLETILIEPPAYTVKTNNFIKQLSTSIKKVTKETVRLSGASGASDVRFYTSTGSAGVEFGLKGANHHADNEWVDKKSVEDYYNILKEFLLSIN